jgi:Centromere DNA-binding protein complex CBF3 subunit, domain 2
LVDIAAQTHTGGEIRPADLTGREFISLLKGLRLIFLQDAAIPLPTYPDLPLWKLPIFRDPEWHTFAEAVRHCQDVEEEPADVRTRAVVPAIAEAVHGATNRTLALLVDTKAIMALQTGVVLQKKSFTGGCRRGSRKSLQLPRTVSTTSEKKPDLP